MQSFKYNNRSRWSITTKRYGQVGGQNNKNTVQNNSSAVNSKFIKLQRVLFTGVVLCFVVSKDWGLFAKAVFFCLANINMISFSSPQYLSLWIFGFWCNSMWGCEYLAHLFTFSWLAMDTPNIPQFFSHLSFQKWDAGDLEWLLELVVHQ